MRNFIIILAVLFAGCNPCKRLAQKCPPEIHHDSVYIETVKMDTITLVSPADTLWFQIPVEFDLNDLLLSVEDKPGPSVEIKIKDGIMEVTAICPEDSLKTVIAQKNIELSNRTTITKEVEVPVRYTGKFAKFAIIFFFCCVFIAIVAIVYRIKVGTLKSALNRFTNKNGG